ncbi:MAG TPA: D-aminoacylase [Arenimonas sp.]|nr:D-aminoacylase [Arenimonas sp.]
MKARCQLVLLVSLSLFSFTVSSTDTPTYDLVIKNAIVYDGTGAAPQSISIAVNADRVVAHLPSNAKFMAKKTVDAKQQALAPGFINMLSWATESLIVDGRGQSDLRQGVTLEVFGEGESMGPVNPAMKKAALAQQGDYHFDIPWSSLGEYLEHLQQRGISMNVASLVGATTVRIHELGYENRAPTADELKRMQNLVRQAMDEGALGVGASLIYAPAFYAKTEELMALSQTAAESGGGYMAHMRSEANRLHESLDELISIARHTKAHAEVYHMKAGGKNNWPKMAQMIDKINQARAEGLSVSANMYTYTAGATGFDAAMPPWVQEGGLDAWIKRLQDPKTRAQVIQEIRTPSNDWENLYLFAGAQGSKLVGFKTEKLKPLTGKTLAEVAQMRGTSPEDTMIDLIIEDQSRIEVVYFLMSEDNVRLGLKQPWVSLGSDSRAMAPEGVFLKSSSHPRAYGTFSRFLGRYVRDEKLTTLEDGIYRLTGLPAKNWKLRDRGCLAVGCYADLVLFDPSKIQDHATFDEPQQFSTGVNEVWVNGVQVLQNGEPTDARPGRVVRGPGWKGWK